MIKIISFCLSFVFKFHRTIFVHGFAVDDNGYKMSKSLGNVVNPQDIIHGGFDKKKQPGYGIDVLR